jgi:hypothetical protein
MKDDPLPETDDERHDYVHIKPPRIQIRRERSAERPNNRLAVGVAIGSLLLQLGAIAWTGGRLEQSNIQQDKALDQHAAEIKEVRADVAQHASVLSATNATYAEILRRLESGDQRATRIETKIDELGRNSR